MAKTYKVCHIICEGSSEIAYVNELGKYIREAGYELFLKQYNLNGISSYKGIKKKYSEVSKAAKHKKTIDEIFIWLDNDIFKRDRLSKDALQQILGGFSGIKYNYENFEDFLVMHLPDEQVHHWHEICRKNNHFDTPLTGKKTETLIRSIFPGYAKGFLPQELQINDESLRRLNENQKKLSIKFRSDFVYVIKQLLKV